MAKKPQKPPSFDDVEKVAFGSEKHVALVASGYGMTPEDAKAIIEERKDDPHTHPYQEMKMAEALLEQLKAKPEVISPEPGWQRQHAG